MSQRWQRRTALGLAIAAFLLAGAALIVAIARRAPAPERMAPSAPTHGRGSAAALASAHRIDATHYEISRADVETVMADPGAAARTVRVVPATGGVRLFGIEPRSLLDRLGFQNGDLIRAVEGMDVSTPASALEIYSQLRGASEITIDLERGGVAQQLSIAIR